LIIHWRCSIRIIIGAGAAVAAVGTYAVYSKVSKKKKKKKVKTKNGKTRDINCDVLVDPNGNELHALRIVHRQTRRTTIHPLPSKVQYLLHCE